METERTKYLKVMEELVGKYGELKGSEGEIEEGYLVMRDVFINGGKLLMCGNGGSAGTCEGFSSELLAGGWVKGARKLGENWREVLGEGMYEKLRGGLPAIPLSSFTAVGTAYGNDCDPEYVFGQLVWGMGKLEDGFLGVSTSGNSRNVLRGSEVARAKGMKTVGLTGRGGGELKGMVDVCVCVAEEEVFRVQELHLAICHGWCRMLEGYFFK